MSGFVEITRRQKVMQKSIILNLFDSIKVALLIPLKNLNLFGNVFRP